MLPPTSRHQQVLIRRDLVAIPAATAEQGAPAPTASLATVAANIAHFGFALSADAYGALARLDEAALGAWWGEVDVVLAVLTGDDKDMGSAVVYKNFPAEVLAMDEAEYWLRQVLLYWGLPSALVTQPARERAPLADGLAPRVLHLADDGALRRIRDALFASPARWIDDQWQDVLFAIDALDQPVDLAALPFVENRVRLAAALLERGRAAAVGSATDVLRLAAALSGGDVSLREPCRLRRLARRERVYLLGLLEGARNLDEDLARRPELAKRLLQKLHPGDYRDRFPRVAAAYDRLYNAAPIPRFNADLERLLAARDREALALLQARPGEFARRLHATLLLFQGDAAAAFGEVIGELATIQLLKLRRYLATVDQRAWRAFPPKGDWGKVQIVAADRRRQLPAALRGGLIAALSEELARRVSAVGPVALDGAVERVKLQTNDNELSPYGRGTAFPLPENVRFIRTATYWKADPARGHTWFDNGWNLLSETWSPLGVCCWNSPKFHDAAVFSGDPTNANDLEGRACQLIDLYPDKLAKRGVAYAVWTVLCYSRLPFSKAIEVYAALQWGKSPQAGKLFEPSRCQLSFPLRGDSLTKYVVYLDLRRRELVYLDADLPARVQSAGANGALLQRTMPAFVEYLGSLPSVHDLFARAPQDPAGMPVLYDDAARPLAGNRPAYVFRPTNQDSAFTPFDPGSLL